MSRLHETEKPLLDTSKAETGKIPLTLYDQIVELLPISSVEAIISKGNSLLFLRRKTVLPRDNGGFQAVGLEKEKRLEKRCIVKSKRKQVSK